jgi:hypothetical protein
VKESKIEFDTVHVSFQVIHRIIDKMSSLRSLRAESVLKIKKIGTDDSVNSIDCVIYFIVL